MLLAKNLKELEALVPQPNINFKKECKFIPLEKLYFESDNIIKIADEYERKNDYERSYIFRMKFILYVDMMISNSMSKR
jgi:hypothetical protein